MGKFLLGLVIGLVVGVLVAAYNPDLPEEVRTTLASLTGSGPARDGGGGRGHRRGRRRGGGRGEGSHGR